MTKRSLLALVAVVAMLFAVLPLTAASAAGVPVFINEIHYDNVGTDTGEFVEVAGTAGTDLAGWTIALYNGSNGTVYNTINLSGVIDDEGAGFGALDFHLPVNGLQNGAPDGMALVDATPAVVQFLSYEGTITATAGPAIGSTSTDIGQAEGSSTAIGDSLQLVGTGTGYDDFTWTGPVAESPGSINAGQTFDGGGGSSTTSTTPTTLPPGPVADVIINELDSDTIGTDALEFVELYDHGIGNTALDGLSLVFFNGSSDTVYTSIDLDGYSTDGGGYFVAGNPAVAGVDVQFAGNGLQNGADAVALLVGDYSNGDPVPGASVIVDAIVYDTNDADDAGLLALLNAGQPQVNEDGAGDKDNHSNQRCPNGTGGARNTSTYQQWAPTPGAENICTVPVLDAGFQPIHAIQGSGLASPYVGYLVSTTGVVVGDHEGVSPTLRGLFIQSADHEADANPETSEGIFVFLHNTGDNFQVGDYVEVHGTVDEFFNQTQIGNVTSIVKVSDGAPVTPATVSMPVGSVDEWEAYEGMLVTIPQTLSVTETYNQVRYGEIELSSGGPLDNPTNVAAPGAAAAAVSQANTLRRIQVDDGMTNQNPDPTPYLDIADPVRIGDTITGLTGVLGYSFGRYEIQPLDTAPSSLVSFDRTNPRPVSPPSVGGDLTVASFNVLNYFTTIDTGAAICGPSGNLGCRGADSVAEFDRQKAKIVKAILALDADIVGLMEIENHVTDAALDDLVAALNADGSVDYKKVDSGFVGDDAIKVAIIYDEDAVSAVGAHAVLDSSVDPLFVDSKNRPTLAQTFQDSESGGRFTVAVNHLKSKGSACDDLGDPDNGDFQGNCNATRTNAATALVNWLETDPTGSGDPDVLIIGDLNSYAMEDPIAAITDAGYSDLIRSFQGVGVAQDAYSYVFSGELGYLDHALSNADMTAQITGAAFWHTNANESLATDYDLDFNRPPGNYQDTLYRASDHDAVVIGVVTATSAMEDIAQVGSEIDELIATSNSHAGRHLAKAKKSIDKALNPSYWDGEMIDSKKVFDQLKKAVKEIDKASDHGDVDSGEAEDLIAVLVQTARDAASEALNDAEAAPTRPRHLDHGWERLLKGDDEAAKGKWDKAISNYRKAWQEAGKAVK